jgi:aminoglycoside phosphotransferase (APT) family kinase protein
VLVKSAALCAETPSSGSVAHEASVLAQLHRAGLPVPRPIATTTGPRSTVLVLDDPDGVALEEVRRAAGGSAPAWATAVGAALAEVHTTRRCGLPERLPRTDRVRRLLQTWTASAPRGASAGYAQFLGQLRRTGVLQPLEETAAAWSPSALIHGDLSGQAVLCGPDPAADRPLRLVDWAAAGLGDPRWDIGCLIADTLLAWMSRQELQADDGLDTWTVPADPPFAVVREDIAAAVSGYAAGHPVSPGDRRQWVRYAGVALLQRIADTARRSPVLPPRCADQLQVAGQLLRRPELSGELLLCQ